MAENVTARSYISDDGASFSGSKLKYPDKYRRVRCVPGRQPGRNPRSSERESQRTGRRGGFEKDRNRARNEKGDRKWNTFVSVYRFNGSEGPFLVSRSRVSNKRVRAHRAILRAHKRENALARLTAGGREKAREKKRERERESDEGVDAARAEGRNALHRNVTSRGGGGMLEQGHRAFLSRVANRSREGRLLS